MLGVGLIIGGFAAMIFGMVMLSQWNNGGARWFDTSPTDDPGASRGMRQFLDIIFCFVPLVIVPLLGGAIAVLHGLHELL